MMKRATLYLMVGYPGAGKTTVSQIIHELTGAVHIWADYERRAMFGDPTHSASESRELYKHLNNATELLLSDGKSVIFDTNFNFRKDRDKLRDIAAARDADVVLVWVKVGKDVARKRATTKSEAQATRLLGDIPESDFNRMTGNLQPPDDDEKPVILDGTRITPEYVAEQLDLPLPKATNRSAHAAHAVQPAKAPKLTPGTHKHG